MYPPVKYSLFRNYILPYKPSNGKSLKSYNTIIGSMTKIIDSVYVHLNFAPDIKTQIITCTSEASVCVDGKVFFKVKQNGRTIGTRIITVKMCIRDRRYTILEPMEVMGITMLNLLEVEKEHIQDRTSQ